MVAWRSSFDEEFGLGRLRVCDDGRLLEAPLNPDCSSWYCEGLLLLFVSSNATLSAASAALSKETAHHSPTHSYGLSLSFYLLEQAPRKAPFSFHLIRRLAHRRHCDPFSMSPQPCLSLCFVDGVLFAQSSSADDVCDVIGADCLKSLNSQTWGPCSVWMPAALFLTGIHL